MTASNRMILVTSASITVASLRAATIRHSSYPSRDFRPFSVDIEMPIMTPSGSMSPAASLMRWDRRPRPRRRWTSSFILPAESYGSLIRTSVLRDPLPMS